jgi:REP element-mobilizing transposase RayT
MSGMPRTIGYHLVFSAYGLWLPGDERGHWSDAWDQELGFIEPHMLHEGDPVRKRMAEERQAHPKVLLNPAMLAAVEDAIGMCRRQSDWRIAAASIESTHTHLLLTYTERDIDTTAKWLKDQTTKAVHRQTSHAGPVWCKGRWRGFIFDPLKWRNTRLYIERHNERRGVAQWLDPKAPTLARIRLGMNFRY